MGKGFKGLAALGFIGGTAFGGFKAYEQYEYLKESYNNMILFNGEKLIYDEVFEGDSVACVATGVEIDLREADFDADYSNLDLYGMCSGIKVLVPNNVQVIATGVNKASGVEVNIDDAIEGKILNITYDLTASGLMITSVPQKPEEVKAAEEEATELDVEEVTADLEDELMAEIDELRTDLEEEIKLEDNQGSEDGSNLDA